MRAKIKTNRLPIPKLPEKYEKFVKKICGPDWKYSSPLDLEGGLGVAICKAILDGQSINLSELADHFGLDSELLTGPYERLSKNGYMKSGKLDQDGELVKGETLAWCYLAGIASGATGVGS